MRRILNKSILLLGVVALTASGCSDQTSDNKQGNLGSEIMADTSTDAANVAGAETEAAAITSAGNPNAAEMPNLPQLAYVYGFEYSLPAQEMSGLMRRHANICEQQGPASCQILGMNLSGEIENGNRSGVLQLAVATRHARAVGALLEDEATDAEAEQVAANISTDELSKQLVDTQARIETRTALRDRLMQVLKTRKGSVKELVEAERSVAQVNEEIDQARSWLNEMQGRVAFSKIDIDYQSSETVGGDFLGPVKGAFSSLGSILGVMMAALIVLLSVTLPIAGILLAIKRLTRHSTAEPVLGSEG